MTATAETVIRTATDDEIASVEEQLRLLFVRVRAVVEGGCRRACIPTCSPSATRSSRRIVHAGPHARRRPRRSARDRQERRQPPGASTSRSSGSPSHRGRPGRRARAVHRRDARRDREHRPEGLPDAAAAATRSCAPGRGGRRRRARATARPADVRGRGSAATDSAPATDRSSAASAPGGWSASIGGIGVRVSLRVRRSATGSRTVNRVAPGSLDTSTAPWCASTTPCTIASPSPVLPAGASATSRRARTARRASRRSSAGMPGPSSVDGEHDVVAVALERGDHARAVGRVHAGVREQVRDDLAQPRLVARDDGRAIRAAAPPSRGPARPPAHRRRPRPRPGRGRRAGRRARAPRRGGRAAAGPRRARSCAPTPTRCGRSRASRRAAARRRAFG